MFDLAIVVMSKNSKRVVRFQPRHSGTCFLPAFEQLPASILNPSPSVKMQTDEQGKQQEARI